MTDLDPSIATTVILDGTAVTAGCQCDKNGRRCEFPCWQRIGLTTQPCCPGCPPLEDDDG